MAKIVELIFVSRTIGKGTADDPVRETKELWSLDGELVYIYDPINDVQGKGFPKL